MTDNKYIGQLVMTEYLDFQPTRKSFAIGIVTCVGKGTYEVEWLNAPSFLRFSFYREDTLNELIDKYNVMRQTSTGAFR